MNVSIGSAAIVKTDGEGRFRARGLGPGPYRVRLTNRPEIGLDDIPGSTHNVRLVIPR
ncbi:MAG: carboxypeptidase regulatory-like domain-containing protein [Phycisphaeraceae bacterium]|nr:carboxypeptidase regulatory-like domain-containing protein [Phycisphaeraceae bacterium]